MRILEKHPISIVGHYLVMEGQVEMPECGSTPFCWVEDENGNMVSEFVDQDLAMGIAEQLAGEEGTPVDDNDDGDDAPPRWLH
ncbi:hypothetical protein [Noviherbaspirillum aridicola]|uniref:Uncharacterized protein n=1 Tax=Noviherbaspirillum aridicola TaxID=2849687 RepID=A0ABQ4Q0H3_9BURK|nr:hypothetical protein [Noviherbaspirillum aridicola]GIZ50254.1 hypothetical protein NCCP691_02680 [Noviherbaspirillum aridicola]